MSDSQSTNGNTHPSPSSILEELRADSDKNRPDLATLSQRLSDKEPAAGEEELAELIETVDGLLPNELVSFDEDLTKANLEELILLLVVVRGQTNGKQTLGDISRIFGHRLSPGTVYPLLHKLEQNGILGMHEEVRTKEYSLCDPQAAQSRLAITGVQHLALATMFFETFEQLEHTTPHEIDQ